MAGAYVQYFGSSACEIRTTRTSTTITTIMVTVAIVATVVLTLTHLLTSCSLQHSLLSQKREVSVAIPLLSHSHILRIVLHLFNSIVR